MIQGITQTKLTKALRRGFVRPAALLSRAGAIVAGLIMLAMIGHILLEITLRAVFDSSTYTLDEFVGYGIAAMTFLALAHALNTNTHIRVSILRDAVSPRTLRLLESSSILVAFVVMSLVAYYIALSVIRNFERGTTSATIAHVPLWIPEGLILLGLGMLLVAMAARLVNTWLPEEG